MESCPPLPVTDRRRPGRRKAETRDGGRGAPPVPGLGPERGRAGAAVP